MYNYQRRSKVLMADRVILSLPASFRESQISRSARFGVPCGWQSPVPAPVHRYTATALTRARNSGIDQLAGNDRGKLCGQDKCRMVKLRTGIYAPSSPGSFMLGQTARLEGLHATVRHLEPDAKPLPAIERNPDIPLNNPSALSLREIITGRPSYQRECGVRLILRFCASSCSSLSFRPLTPKGPSSTRRAAGIRQTRQ